MGVAAVIFDLDGVLIDSEDVWDSARRQVALANGGRWTPRATRAMIGMSSTEWSSYMHDELGVSLAPGAISGAVVAKLEGLYKKRVPVLPGAVEAVGRLGKRYRLGLASSANRELIDLVLDLLGLAECFAAAVSSEEVAHGKPAPDVYLEAARRVGADASRCVALRIPRTGSEAPLPRAWRWWSCPTASSRPTEMRWRWRAKCSDRWPS